MHTLILPSGYCPEANICMIAMGQQLPQPMPAKVYKNGGKKTVVERGANYKVGPTY